MAKKQNIIRKTFMAVCRKDQSHEFPVVVDVIEGTDMKDSELEVFCPDCGTMSTIKIKGELQSNTIVTRGSKAEK